MKMLLAGGGTGGHLFPAVALAQQLLAQDPGAKVLFVGTERGLERRLLPKLGLPLATVDMVGVVGRGWKGRLEIVPKLVRSLFQARRILKDFGPDVVVGVGGYASVPILLAARLGGVPYLIHEQNAIPGLSNRVLARWARLVCLSFPGSGEAFQRTPTLVTGNPLRPGFDKVAEKIGEQGHLLVFGGSRGARAINRAVVDMLPILKAWENRPRIYHQTGDEDFDEVEQAYRAAGYDQARVVPFIDDMAEAYDQARLVICRAGATTLAELAACGRPAVLIPFPYAAADHQTANARMMESAGAARVLIQDELSAEALAAQVEKLLGDHAVLQSMADEGRKLGQPEAAGKILDQCRELMKQTNPEVV